MEHGFRLPMAALSFSLSLSLSLSLYKLQARSSLTTLIETSERPCFQHLGYLSRRRLRRLVRLKNVHFIR